ncbi:MAG TPA: ROK family protein [Candidatus Corynebacterium gallistercoris]|uniref:ROK family protein n=1 Tax=Candidatus Corynebacterium gallistercoris TaxID=2838530 RepID=A0A9D1UPY2_9CORY|nr:ROK family protein [Candidatus Corynebacterium gallistercoris]
MTDLEHSLSDNPQLGFGVDIGGSGVKGAVVDLATGDLVTERFKILTPKPSTPDAVAEVVAQLMEMAGWNGPVGITVPAVVKNQHARSAANIDKAWIDTDLQELFARHLGEREIAVLNDADAAGLAEVELGDELARKGTVLMLTFGTGIGSAMLHDGQLFPNSELGHLPFNDKGDAEWHASSAAKDREELSYKKWAKRVDEVLHLYSRLFSPQTFIVGGGISRKADKWVPLLTVEQDVIPAKLRNQAGIIGAAMAVRDGIKP